MILFSVIWIYEMSSILPNYSTFSEVILSLSENEIKIRWQSIQIPNLCVVFLNFFQASQAVEWYVYVQNGGSK